MPNRGEAAEPGADPSVEVDDVIIQRGEVDLVAFAVEIFAEAEEMFVATRVRDAAATQDVVPDQLEGQIELDGLVEGKFTVFQSHFRGGQFQFDSVVFLGQIVYGDE